MAGRRWLRFVSCVSRHPVTPMVVGLLGLQNLVTGVIFLAGLSHVTQATILARLLDQDGRVAWLVLWGAAMALAGFSQVYGAVLGRWYCAVAGGVLALSAQAFSMTVYAQHLEQGWVALLTPALFAWLLNAYALVLASVAQETRSAS